MLRQLAFQRIHRSVRWVGLGQRTAWISPSGGSYDGELAFVNPRLKLDGVELFTSDGQSLGAHISPIDELSPPLDRFNVEPAGSKSFFRMQFAIDSVDVITGRSESLGDLFTLVPTTPSPTFVFDILQTAAVKLPGVRFSTFVETGTLYAHTAYHASKWFDEVISIELDESLHQGAVDLGLDGVRFVHGDSGDVVPAIVDELTQPAFFFLDAHWSGDPSVEWGSSGFQGFPTATAHLGEANNHPSSEQQVPLDRELSAILESFPHHAIIVIDDWESVGEKDHAFTGEDWTHLAKEDIERQFAVCDRTIATYRHDAKHFVAIIGPIG